MAEELKMEIGNNSVDKQFISNFILSAISDVKETVRFTDTKVGVTFALYGLIINAIVEARNNIYEAFKIIFNCSPCYGFIYLILIGFTFICIVVSISYLMFTITPRKSIEEYITTGMTDFQKQMWLVQLNKERNKNQYPLNITLDNYYKDIIKQNEDSLIKGEALELLKLSFIRNKKVDCFDKGLSWFKRFLLLITIVGVVTVVTIVVNGWK